MNNTVEVLYISSLCSTKTLKFIFDRAIAKPEQAEQKFHRLLAEGLSLNNKVAKIEALSIIPVTKSLANGYHWSLPNEFEHNIHYRYVPFIDISLLKNIFTFFYSFFHVLKWGHSATYINQKIVIFDVLKFSISAGAVMAAKVLGLKSVAILTDLPGLMVAGTNEGKNLKISLYNKLVRSFLKKFDNFLLLTKQMNDVVNPSGKPHLIMEGLVDVKMEERINKLQNKSEERILIYAGGIYEKYGVKTLLDAFLELQGHDLRLHIYGAGELASAMPHYMNMDPRIIYKGVVPNPEIVARQLEATLLINPRPSKEEFTKYSFPSKNMEYMVSGTPLITTRLPGMPKEYEDYVYLFDDESVAGMRAALTILLNKPKEELHSFGCKSKEFVLKNKNNHLQADRLLNMLV